MARAPRRRPAPRRRRQQRQRRVPDSTALRGIQQGVARSVVRAFGSNPVRRKRRAGRGKRMAGFHPCHLDAFHQAHLSLPRPTGPYTVIRTTQLLVSDTALAILGPTFDRQKGVWTNHCAYWVNDTTKKLDDTSNMWANAFTTISGGNWTGAQVTPAAYSVQLMNPNALQTTNGVVYAGRLRTEYKISENVGKKGDEIAQEFVSYNNPRLMSAAKLAFRGVQMDIVPFNMSELANFTRVEEETTGAFTGAATMNNNTGFAPLFVYNPNKINLQYLVCCEWRVRFDPSNPAQASHVLHQHVPENFWMQAMHYAESIGNGVVDIADRVAETGNALFNASYGAYRGAKGMKALTAGVGQLALA